MSSTDGISGTSSASSAQYTSGIQSSSRPGGGMNAAALQQWLQAQVGAMWDKVSDATNGVDSRNKSQEELTNLQRRAAAGEEITAEEVRDVASRMPDGQSKENVLALVANCAPPEKIAELTAAKEKADAAADAAAQRSNSWSSSHNPWEWGNNPHTLEASNLRAAAHNAQLNLNNAGSSTVKGADVAKGFENAAGALSKENDLAMVQLQYTASTAQQAMSLVGNILKIQGDAAKETIGKIS